MDYNLYLFSKLADAMCPEIQEAYEVDLKWDILLKLYDEYNKSPYPTRMSLSDYDAMHMWFSDRIDSKMMEKLQKEVTELKWRLKCVTDDAKDMAALYYDVKHQHLVGTMIDTHLSNIEIANDFTSDECFDWKIDGENFNNQ